MTPDEFRTQGKALVDWIADYWETIEDRPVLSQVEPGWVRSQLPEHPPEHGEPFEAMLADVDRAIMPGITHWQHPGFHAYFNSGGSAPSVLGDLLSSGLGVQGMLWATSPAATELETLVLDWLAELLDLPEAFRSTSTGGGVIQDSASSATLVALLAARERAGEDSNTRGVRQGEGGLVVYASEHAHSSIEKAARIAGFGTDFLRSIPTDADHGMRPDALAEAMATDAAAGLTPAIVVASIGTTSTTAIDPVREIAKVAADHGAWVHVDAALAGTAALVPEHRWIHDGLELVDSYVMNPHKWMLTTFDASAFWVADRAPLIEALSVLPEYLRNAASEAGAVIDYRDWQIPLGRRFRALKLWFVIRSFGAEGLRDMVRRHLELTDGFDKWVRHSDSYAIAAPTTVNLVCFRHVGGETEGRRVMDAINVGGEAYLTHTVVDGEFILRAAIGAERTEQRHIDRLCELLDELA